ncbi:uncharacterized protein M6B38_157065 [Iris pallida]|uniref:GPI inositol-deacylase n=1 Tax=Iris pallida TaxID=29817 RepID=A0AAX6F1C6_IRIPA|nr:uncharacterized protein M6B38_157065 [Iris pallida]
MYVLPTPTSCSSISTKSSPPPPPASARRLRPAVILPGLGNNSGDYEKLASTLGQAHGVRSAVARVSRLDWLRNAAGLLDPNYWKGTLRPSPVLDWYLDRVRQAVLEAKSDAGGGCVSLVGHSAGGWLARVYMERHGRSDVSLLLTLGTPHLPPPKGVPGVIDQTRGLLDYVQNNCAPAVYTPQLKYVCVAGRYIQGARLISNPPPPELILPADSNTGIVESIVTESGNSAPPPAPTFRALFVGQGYKQVCGRADVWGDGVVPEVSAHLEGALNISLDGVYHSPVGADDVARPWYGSPAVVEKWIHHLLD